MVFVQHDSRIEISLFALPSLREGYMVEILLFAWLIYTVVSHRNLLWDFPYECGDRWDLLREFQIDLQGDSQYSY